MVDRYWSAHLGRYVTAPDYDDDTARWQRRQEAILRSEGAPAPDEDEQTYRGYVIRGERCEVWQGRTRIGAAWTLDQARRLIDAHIER